MRRRRYLAVVGNVTATRTALVESLMERFPHVPREAVLKEDLLRTGIAFDDATLSDNLDGEVNPKSYFIFSFDQKPLAELGEAARRRPPEELALTGGPYGLRRTIRPQPVLGLEAGLRLASLGVVDDTPKPQPRSIRLPASSPLVRGLHVQCEFQPQCRPRISEQVVDPFHPAPS